MSLPSPNTAPPLQLPAFDRTVLRVIETVVPRPERAEWIRNWQAELWHMHHRRRNQGNIPTIAATTDLSIGLTRDALWLRTDSWRRTYSGSAILCQASLFGISLLSVLMALLLKISWHALAAEYYRSLVAAPLVLFVTFATAPRRHIEPEAAGRMLVRMRRRLFFAGKTEHILFFSFLLSADAFEPLHASLPNVADVMQVFAFVLFALIGMRWAFRDQDERCKHCLHTLATPERVGRPSHNLLEWNGSELTCKHGHGRLSVPEMETSWCQSSHWIDVDTGWDEAAFL